MRIGVVHNWYRSGQPSGENAAVATQVRGLLEAGHDVRLFSARSDDLADAGRLANVAVGARLIWSASSRAAFAASLADWTPRVVHVHNTFPLLSPAVLGVPRRFGVPVVATLHNFRLICANGVLTRDHRPCTLCVDARMPWPAVRHRCYRDSVPATVPVASGILVHRSLGTWIRCTTRVTVPSEFVRSQYATYGFSPNVMTVLPNGIDVPKIPSLTEHGRKGTRFVFLGRLSTDKGVDVLLRAWRPELGELRLVGSGDLEQQARSAAAADPSITLLGQLPYEDAMGEVARSDVLVAPSVSYEAFGLTVGEAFAYGKPVIATTSGGLPELVTQERGLLVAPGDAEALTAAMRRLTDPELARRLGAAGQQLWAEKLTQDRVLAGLEQVYEDAIREKSTGVDTPLTGYSR